MALPTTTTASPGNLVVPLSAIIDQLQGKLSAADLNALLLAVVSKRRTEVQPGDLITADLINQILADVADLNLRVAQLEAGTTSAQPGEVVIIDPRTGTSMRVGEHVEITGLNFGFSLAQQRVLFDDVPVSGFESGSNDNLLRVVVPALPSVGIGRPAVLKVSNATSTATRAIQVLPPDQPLTGTVDITAGPSQPSPVVANQNADFPFTLSPRGLNRAAEFQLAATLTGQSWQTRLLDSTKTELNGGKVTLAPDATTAVYVRVAVPAGANGQTVSLSLSVAADAVHGSSSIGSYTVGQPPDPSDDTITLNPGNVLPAGTLVDGKIRLAANGFANIPVTLASTKAGGPFRYDLRLELVPQTAGAALATGWTFGFLQPATNPPSQTQAVTPNIGASGTIVFAVAADANPSASGRLRLRVQRQGDPLPKVLDLDLEKATA